MNFLPSSLNKKPKEEIDHKFRIKSHIKDIWTVLHTSSVYLPETLNEKLEQDYNHFVDGILLFATKEDKDLYNFVKDYKKKNRYNFSSRENASLWLCNLHNSFNLKNDKYLFECTTDNLTQRYGNFTSINKTNSL